VQGGLEVGEGWSGLGLRLGARRPRRRYFEDVQGRLEVAVEQSALPLALMPDVQIIMRAAEAQARARPGAPPPPPGAGLPPPTADRPLPVRFLKKKSFIRLARAVLI